MNFFDPVFTGTYLYTPPQRTQFVTLAGRGLIYQYPVSSTVWKNAAGAWQTAETPSPDLVAGATYFFTRPVIVSNAVATELNAAGFGQLNPIQQ